MSYELRRLKVLQIALEGALYNMRTFNDLYSDWYTNIKPMERQAKKLKAAIRKIENEK